MGILSRLASVIKPRAETTGGTLTLTDPAEWRTGGSPFGGGLAASMKVSAVNAAVEIRSDSFGKLPIFVMNERTKEHVEGHYLTRLLADRPNEAMTPFVLKKLLEVHRLQRGNAYLLAIRSPSTGKPVELLPLHPDTVYPYVDDGGVLWYIVTNMVTGERRKFRSWDIVHLKGYSEDGITGVSVLSRAAQTIRTAMAQQTHEQKFYDQSARPSGVLAVESDLSPEARDAVRKEWDKIHGGADNAFRVAVLTNGFKYQPVALSQRESQFVESKEVTVADIARFYGVPLYKLQSGKQSYDSNEQNGIEYVVSSLHPTVQQVEEEFSYKLLFDSELRRGLEVRINMNAEMRGAMEARGKWYQMMRLAGAFSVNDILALEDRPAVPGGDERIASLNYVPLELFRELSQNRNGAKQETEKETEDSNEHRKRG